MSSNREDPDAYRDPVTGVVTPTGNPPGQARDPEYTGPLTTVVTPTPAPAPGATPAKPNTGLLIALAAGVVAFFFFSKK